MFKIFPRALLLYGANIQAQLRQDIRDHAQKRANEEQERAQIADREKVCTIRTLHVLHIIALFTLSLCCSNFRALCKNSTSAKLLLCTGNLSACAPKQKDTEKNSVINNDSHPKFRGANSDRQLLVALGWGILITAEAHHKRTADSANPCRQPETRSSLPSRSNRHNHKGDRRRAPIEPRLAHGFEPTREAAQALVFNRLRLKLHTRYQPNNCAAGSLRYANSICSHDPLKNLCINSRAIVCWAAVGADRRGS